MQISISNSIGGSRGLGVVKKIINSFKTRVLADGGTFEAETCLNTTLTNLN